MALPFTGVPVVSNLFQYLSRKKRGYIITGGVFWLKRYSMQMQEMTSCCKLVGAKRLSESDANPVAPQ